MLGFPRAGNKAGNKQARDEDDEEETVERKIMEVLPYKKLQLPLF